MVEDNTPTVTARRRKPSQRMRIRLDTARRLQALNSKTKARRAAAKTKLDQEEKTTLAEQGSHAFNIAPRVPKIKKNKLSRPTPAEPKYRKRQKCKTWLPTHLYHAKRAHMATTKDPLWRFAIPLSPTEKSYRPTHRARGARGAVAWDMSYMSTIQLEGTEVAIQAVLMAVGVEGENAWGAKGKKWRAGTRSLQAWTFEKDHRSRLTAPVTLVWCAKHEDVEMIDADHPQTKTSKDYRKLWIRVHPSAFLQLWTDVLDVSKKQNPPVMVEDLRFEIGSIEVTGPGSAEALLATLKPILGPDGNAPSAQSPEATWQALLGVSNPSSLPNNALLSFAVSDPRLHFPSRTLHVPDNESHMNDLAILLSAWSPDKTQGPSTLFDRSTRLTAARQLPSQKAINRRRTLAGPGKYPLAQPSDPQIPVMILANKPEARAKRSNAPGSWTVLLPWKCVVPVWYSLMFYPLSSGGNPLLGGLKQQQQLAFEAGEAWFPGDFPGTRAGWEWGQRETKKSQREWERRPKGRRPEFDNMVLGEGRPKGEIGHGWACDWERLLQGPGQGETAAQTADGSHKVESGKKPADAKEPVSIDTSSPTIPPLNIHNVRYPRLDSSQTLNKFDKASVDASTFGTVYISLASRGTPTPRARIYRLPTDPALRQKWLDIASGNTSKHAESKVSKKGNPVPASEEARRLLAESLISSPTEESDLEHLEVPAEEDLIGFVTTGNYNLSEGKGTGIGSIQITKVLEPNVKLNERRTCIIRAAGEKSGRLGMWEFV
jgi:ribonuclease P/MRP protein subunit POP1